MSVKCPVCGAELQEGQPCPNCSPQREGTAIDRIAFKTGKLIEKGVDVTDKAIEGVKPAAKELAKSGKKGLRLMKDATLGVAKDLKRKSQE